jgi:serine/threonine protein kinase
VVHGDLKAANVLLTHGGEDVGGLWARNLGYRVTAKVADFGLALSLDPKDTHATMAARMGADAWNQCCVCITCTKAAQLPVH